MTPSTTTSDALLLIDRALMAYLFVPAGWAKIVGFAGTVGYINSKGLPLPEVAAVVSIVFEPGSSVAARDDGH